jgi:hypothetical protein
MYLWGENRRMGNGGKDTTMNYMNSLMIQILFNQIKAKRLAWAGHLTRMSNDRTLKKIFNTKPDGTRSVGRPKLRWEDGVVQDTRILGVKNWKRAALERDEWAKLLKKAKAHQGRSSQ